MKKHHPKSITRAAVFTFCGCFLAAIGNLSATDFTLGPEHPVYSLPTVSSPLFLWRPDAVTFRAGSFDPTYTIGAASAAFGYSSAHGDFSFAAGFSVARSAGAAFGSYTEAGGHASFAAGSGTWGLGAFSTAFGSGTTAQGNASTALGEQTFAGAYASVAIGKFNVGSWSPNGEHDWVPEDPVFEIGIGTGTGAVPRSNAITVYKNGRVEIHKRQGDIMMGEFGNPGD